jgi:aspartate aminotransferase-like enzyme
MIKKRLFTPGPVSLYPHALHAALESDVHHRTPEFRAILADTLQSLKKILDDPDHVYLFSSSGTGAMETAVSNFFSPEDQVLIASCGKFGERWIDLAKNFLLDAKVLHYPYGEAVRPEDVMKALKENPKIGGVFLQACESSTGVQNDIDAIASVVRKTDAILVLDAVSALATMPLSCKSGIDVILSGSQKALMIPPGLGFMGITDRAWRRVENATTQRFYFDLRKAKKAWEQDASTPFTPATSLILSLRESLKAMENWGLERLIQLTENRARATRAGLQSLGLEVFARRPANALTAVKVSGDDCDRIVSQLKQRFGFHVAGGQGELKGKIFRISHMGYIDHFDALGVLSSLEIVLKSLGYPITLGTSLVEFQKIYHEVA